jgi:phosphoketolase
MTLSQARAEAAISSDQLEQIDAWWRAANYLAVGMIYLQDNPLLSEPLRPGAWRAWGARADLSRWLLLRDLSR